MKRIWSVFLAALLALSLSCAKEEGAENISSPAGTAAGDSLRTEPAGHAPSDAENQGDKALTALDYDGICPKHEPYGKGVGVMPGRVVWSHAPDAVSWDGEGYWWETDHFDEEAILDMVNESIASLAEKESPAEGWAALFAYNNAARGKAFGYLSGEKIAIKANMNGSGTFADETSGNTRMSHTNPVLLRALLRSLVEEAGVAPSDITVYDVSRVFPDYMIELCTSGPLMGVQFAHRDLLGKRDATADTEAPITWSQTFDGDTNYLPTCVTEAKYLINLANLKGHSYGITLCAKNHFGSLMNTSRLRPPEAAGIHRFVSNPQMDQYTVLVDLMGHCQLYDKTVLYMLDALICAPSEGVSITGENSTWQMAPFNGDYTSSLFVSQDPVAIDSVGADFLTNEPTITERNGAIRDNPNVESYLHEAALVADAPSGAVYFNGNGERLLNLGVHEHWNNSAQKLYSRNLGGQEGIELIYLGEAAGR